MIKIVKYKTKYKTIYCLVNNDIHSDATIYVCFENEKKAKKALNDPYLKDADIIKTELGYD